MIGNLRRWIAVSLGVFLITFLLFQLTSIGGAIAQRGPTKSRGSDVDELFRNNCARCHGADGRGDTPLGQTFSTPDFTDAEWWRKNSDITSSRSLTTIVSRGKARMPAFGKKLKPQEITGLVNYVRRFRR